MVVSDSGRMVSGCERGGEEGWWRDQVALAAVRRAHGTKDEGGTKARGDGVRPGQSWGCRSKEDQVLSCGGGVGCHVYDVRSGILGIDLVAGVEG